MAAREARRFAPSPFRGRRGAGGASSRVTMISLSSNDLSPIEKSVIARWTVRPRLMGVPGVANVSIFGMRDQQLQVQVDPRTLRDKNVTLKQVIATTGNA